MGIWGMMEMLSGNRTKMLGLGVRGRQAELGTKEKAARGGNKETNEKKEQVGIKGEIASQRGGSAPP